MDKKLTVILRISVLTLFLSSSAVILIPFAKNNMPMTMLISGLFWMGILMGYILFFIAVGKIRRARKGERKRFPFLLQNPCTAFFDMCGTACLLVLIFLLIFPLIEEVYLFLFLFVFLFSFHMHWVSGKENYRILFPKKEKHALVTRVRSGKRGQVLAVEAEKEAPEEELEHKPEDQDENQRSFVSGS